MTTFVFRVRNVPAALYKALGGFATNGVNMTKLESYMVEGEFTATQFLADVDGHPNDPALARAFEELGLFLQGVQNLGRLSGASLPDLERARVGIRAVSGAPAAADRIAGRRSAAIITQPAACRRGSRNGTGTIAEKLLDRLIFAFRSKFSASVAVRVATGSGIRARRRERSGSLWPKLGHWPHSRH